MKKIFTYALCGALAAGMMAGCEKKGDEPVAKSEKEQVLQKVAEPYVKNTVIATYGKMADEGMVLLEKVRQMQEAVQNGTDYTSIMKEAGDAWRRMRVYWEQSEAFLFGPAEKHNIDPHIDSWPLDYNEMNALLQDEKRMQRIEEEGGSYVGDKLGYALKGFHAAEYLLFQEGQPHKTDLTKAQAVYLVGIVEDLAQQAVLLEDCWAGGVGKAKEALITDEDGESMSYNENYGDYFINANHPDWKTYQAVAEQIISGCVDIAGEVADLKMGNPYRGSSNGGDSEYLESPYSRTSTTDFIDNIRSIRNAYCCAEQGDASISDYIRSKDSDLDEKLRKTIDESIELIGKIDNFETTAMNNSAVRAAIDKVSELENILDDEVMAILAK